MPSNISLVKDINHINSLCKRLKIDNIDQLSLDIVDNQLHQILKKLEKMTKNDNADDQTIAKDKAQADFLARALRAISIQGCLCTGAEKQNFYFAHIATVHPSYHNNNKTLRKYNSLLQKYRYVFTQAEIKGYENKFDMMLKTRNAIDATALIDYFYYLITESNFDAVAIHTQMLNDIYAQVEDVDYTIDDYLDAIDNTKAVYQPSRKIDALAACQCDILDQWKQTLQSLVDADISPELFYDVITVARYPYIVYIVPVRKKHVDINEFNQNINTVVEKSNFEPDVASLIVQSAYNVFGIQLHDDMLGITQSSIDISDDSSTLTEAEIIQNTLSNIESQLDDFLDLLLLDYSNLRQEDHLFIASERLHDAMDTAYQLLQVDGLPEALYTKYNRLANEFEKHLQTPSILGGSINNAVNKIYKQYTDNIDDIEIMQNYCNSVQYLSEDDFEYHFKEISPVMLSMHTIVSQIDGIIQNIKNEKRPYIINHECLIKIHKCYNTVALYDKTVKLHNEKKSEYNIYDTDQNVEPKMFWVYMIPPVISFIIAYFYSDVIAMVWNIRADLLFRCCHVACLYFIPISILFTIFAYFSTKLWGLTNWRIYGFDVLITFLTALLQTLLLSNHVLTKVEIFNVLFIGTCAFILGAVLYVPGIWLGVHFGYKIRLHNAKRIKKYLMLPRRKYS